MKKAIKKEIKSNLIIMIFSFISLLIGFVASEITYTWRDHLKKGKIIFQIDEDQYSGTLEILSINGEKIILHQIKDNRNFFLLPGQYQINQYIGNYLLDSSIVEIEKNKTSTYTLASDNIDLFIFMMELDKEEYGPGDPIIVTLFSSKKVWIYFYSYENGNLESLNNNGIELEPYSLKMLNKIAANNTKGSDNIIAIALEENNYKLSRNYAESLISNSKAVLMNDTRKWRSKWISFVVKD